MIARAPQREAPAMLEPQRPPLSALPSTPGPDVPGGYPRDSVVFAGNKWDRESEPRTRPQRGGMLSYLPAGVASYFHHPPGSSHADSDSLDNASTTSAPGTPGVLLHTDGSIATTTSNFSTRAYAGSRSSRPSTASAATMTLPQPEPLANPSASANTTTDKALPTTPPSNPPPAGAPLHTEPIPAVAPLAGLTAFAHLHTPPTAKPTGKADDAEKSPPRLLDRFKTLRRGGGRGHRQTASESSMPNPAAALRVENRSPSVEAPAAMGLGTEAQAHESSTAKSKSGSNALMRTLRGEAKVFAGKITRDAGKVEAGRRIMKQS
ncbi:hypothetical protein HMN09_00927800 [Mycena chlorophos]|uniref:Uncharacterized protein n=1 Tax=Mycena chlorophos TaxID=658473 RepID=A0A8H6SJ89_MYCCL|nr:hypothetical protein HMN09_00927800 [Mycena chlorophos]